MQREPGAADRILVFIPAYNCREQIDRTLDQLSEGWVRRVISAAIVVDNRSADGTAEVALEHARRSGGSFVAILRNKQNYGLGGSHKVAFQFAERHGFDWVIVLHGDDQGRLSDFREALESGHYRNTDALLGSRFARGARLEGYSTARRVGNHLFNALYSLALFRAVSDLGSGLNMYRVASLRQTGYLRHPDDLTFNCALLAAQVISGCRVIFTPISWRETDQVSNVRLARQSVAMLRVAARALFHRRSFVSMEHRSEPIDDYRAEALDAG